MKAILLGIATLVEDHERAVSLFEQQKQAKIGDADVQKFIEDELPALRKQLTKARDIERTLGKLN